MYPKAEESPAPPATGVPMSGGPAGYYQGPPGGGTAAFAVQAQAPVAAWSTGLCDCFDDCSNCCVTCLCPCITFGQIAEIVDRGSTSCGASGALYALILFLTGCHCIYSCFYRAKMRAQYGLREEPLRRLLRPLLLRVVRPLPGVPGAQEAGIRHEPRMARQHGEAGAYRRHHAAADAPRHDSLMICR
ncbi:hypothetical protein PR202_gb08900 [Eleusine coracana subsp. coracana]|uniref:Uncharacterized protein n=1 Tax=Eleusine coracana subsp. coracana TaxID=191504 RepID=A0AAV5EGE1_ELECO|nr:hypothetical protein PR202_gb08900 [Eleusine coracana subsp. coracana]